MDLKAAMRAARKAQESTYDSTCTIRGMVDYKKGNGAVGQREEAYIIDQPCHVGKKAISPSNQTDAENQILYQPQLFTSPDNEIKPGSKVTVTRIVSGRAVVTEYEQTGIPAVYETHQEVMMKQSQRKA